MHSNSITKNFLHLNSNVLHHSNSMVRCDMTGGHADNEQHNEHVLTVL